ncbi:MAG: phospholipid-binding protein MlaC [Rickettsiales bacterium]
MRRFYSLAVAGFLTAVVCQSAQAADAKTFVDSVAKQVLAVAQTDAPMADKEQKIEVIFSDKIDIEFIAKFVLAKHWRTATPQQQEAYLTAYKPFVLKNYAGKLAKYSGQTYELRNARSDGEASIVTMVIHDTGRDVLVDYRIQNDKITDIVVENVSLLTTQRSEFNSIVESQGLDYLIGRLQKAAAKN